MQQDKPAVEQNAVLGLVEQPTFSMADAFERFWNHIQDEWMRLSHDQQRVKRNIYLKAMRLLISTGLRPTHWRTVSFYSREMRKIRLLFVSQPWPRRSRGKRR